MLGYLDLSNQKTSWLFSFLYIVAAILLISIHYTSTQKVRLSWESQTALIEDQQRAFNRLESAIGYGGYIHHFKNAVLRGYSDFEQKLSNSKEEAYSAINALRSSLVTGEDINNLNVIENTLNEYLKNERILSEAKVNDIKALDELVKVDDGPAIAALNNLRDSITKRSANADTNFASEIATLEVFSFIFYLLVVASCIQLVTILAIAQRHKRQKESAERLSAHLDSVFNQSPEALLEVDSNGHIVKANTRAHEVLGASGANLVGKAVDDFVPAVKRTAHRELRRAFLHTQETRAMGERTDLKAVRLCGKEFDVEISLNRFEWHNTTLFLVTLKDVTEQRQSQLMMSQKSRLEAVGHLTAGVAHDFNNLLMSISGNKELIEFAESSNKPIKQYLQNIARSVDTASDLNKKLLAFGRKQTLHIRDINCKSLLNEVERLLQSSIHTNVSLDFHCEDDVWDLRVDRNQMETAIINLCINAKQSIQDKGHIIVSANNLTLDNAFTDDFEIPMTGNFVLITISDDGKGILPEHLESIFEPYFTTKETMGGTGLGLSMVYGFLKQIGGHIKIYSEVKVGTTVKLFIPAASETAELKGEFTNAENPTFVKAPDNVKPAKTTILVIEDDETVREVPVMLLQSQGYNVLEAANADVATDLCKNTQCIDIIFTDIVLGGDENGVSLAKTLQQYQQSAKVIYTTGYAPEFVAQELGLKSVDDILMKPYSSSMLFQTIERKLNS